MRPLQSFRLLFPLLVQLVTTADDINNGLTGTPEIVCGNHQLTLKVDTEAPFGGNLYTKGFFQKEECRVRGDFKGNHVEITVPVTADCGARRRRTISPKGMVLEVTVVLMFHRVFLTKIDKAFHIQCQYMEADKDVTQSFDVSMLPTTNLGGEGAEGAGDAAMPTCIYEVLRGGPTGQPVKFAAIGEKVYHKWTCTGPQKDMYCMTVHSCAVDDGQGIGQQLLDENGCAVDGFLLQNLNYPEDLVAGQEAHVFKFADRSTVYFGCQIRLELKEENGGKCVRSADTCGEAPQDPQKESVTVPTPIRETIEPDFPRPPEFEGQEPAKESTEVEPVEAASTEATETTVPPTEEHAVEKSQKRNPRRQRGQQMADGHRTPRELPHFEVNMDVMAPSVDVVDLPEYGGPDSAEVARKVEEAENLDKANIGKVCVSRQAAWMLILTTLVFVGIAIFLCLTIRLKIMSNNRISEIESNIKQSRYRSQYNHFMR